MSMRMRPASLPAEAGVGLRAPHFTDFVSGAPRTGFLEIHPENYFGGGARLDVLEAVEEHYSLSFHCTGLSLGSRQGPKKRHIERLKWLVERFRPASISDHLSWSASGNAHLNDLLPLPYTRESLWTVTANINTVQQALGHRILIENPSLYLNFAESPLEEAEFISDVAARTGCGILLDVNNLFVNQCNNGNDAIGYIDTLDACDIGEIHLAGHSTGTGEANRLKIDTHDQPVAPEVWRLYAYALERFGPKPTLIEWDAQVPYLQALLDEASKAQKMLNAMAAEESGVLRAAG